MTTNYFKMFVEAYALMMEEAEAIDLTSTQAISIEAIGDYSPQTSYDYKRVLEAIRLVMLDLARAREGAGLDSGLAGKVKECLSRQERSTITRVRAQGKIDAFVKVDNKRYPAEVKTNGGRIEALYDVKTPDTYFVIYELEVVIKAGKPRKDGTRKPAEHRYTCKVMTVRQFLDLLDSTKAVKIIGHNEADRERAVQADSKKLYKALMTGGYKDYDRFDTLTWADFTA